jgi:hypothetical protein
MGSAEGSAAIRAPTKAVTRPAPAGAEVSGAVVEVQDVAAAASNSRRAERATRLAEFMLSTLLEPEAEEKS